MSLIMDRKIVALLLPMVCLASFGGSVCEAQQANSSPPEQAAQGFLSSWTSDRHGLAAGDIVTILVDEHLLASAQADESTTQLRDRDLGFSTGTGGTTIRTRNDGRHYYINLLDAADLSVVMSAFLYGGAKIVEHVPVGKYRLKYAVGQKWYGTRWLFGPKTVFKKLDQVFEFKLQNNQIRGYQLDLYLQPVGLASAPKDYAFDF